MKEIRKCRSPHLNVLSAGLNCIWHIRDWSIFTQLLLKPRDEAIHLLNLTLQVERCICSEKTKINVMISGLRSYSSVAETDKDRQMCTCKNIFVNLFVSFIVFFEEKGLICCFETAYLEPYFLWRQNHHSTTSQTKLTSCCRGQQVLRCCRACCWQHSV